MSRINTLPPVLMVAAGGSIGAVGRFLISTWVGDAYPVFPIGTLTVNILGSFLIGIALELVRLDVAGEKSRLFFATGMLGGFTTFSVFSYENWILIEGGDAVVALLNILIQLPVGLGAAFVGVALASRIGQRFSNHQFTKS